MIEVKNLPIGSAVVNGGAYVVTDTETDPVLRSIAQAAIDDEPLTAEDEAALIIADVEIASGQTVPDGVTNAG